jgi:hypothetical protein
MVLVSGVKRFLNPSRPFPAQVAEVQELRGETSRQDAEVRSLREENHGLAQRATLAEALERDCAALKQKVCPCKGSSFTYSWESCSSDEAVLLSSSTVLLSRGLNTPLLSLERTAHSTWLFMWSAQPAEHYPSPPLSSCHTAIPAQSPKRSVIVHPWGSGRMQVEGMECQIRQQSKCLKRLSNARGEAESLREHLLVMHPVVLQPLPHAQIEGAEGQIRQQSERLKEMSSVQGEAESMRERVSALQQQCCMLEATSSLVPGLKSQVSVLTKQVMYPLMPTHMSVRHLTLYTHSGTASRVRSRHVSLQGEALGYMVPHFLTSMYAGRRGEAAAEGPRRVTRRYQRPAGGD